MCYDVYYDVYYHVCCDVCYDVCFDMCCDVYYHVRYHVCYGVYYDACYGVCYDVCYNVGYVDSHTFVGGSGLSCWWQMLQTMTSTRSVLSTLLAAAVCHVDDRCCKPWPVLGQFVHIVGGSGLSCWWQMLQTMTSTRSVLSTLLAAAVCHVDDRCCKPWPVLGQFCPHCWRQRFVMLMTDAANHDQY